MIRRTLTRRALVASLLLAAGASLSAQAVTTTGSLAAVGDAVVIPLVNVPTVAVQLGGTWIGAPVFEATVDGGTTWWPLKVVNPFDGSTAQKALTNGLYLIQNAGYTAARVRAAELGSGTVAVAATRGFGGIAPAFILKGIGPTGAVTPVSISLVGELLTTAGLRLPLPFCNAVLRTNCR